MAVDGLVAIRAGCSQFRCWRSGVTARRETAHGSPRLRPAAAGAGPRRRGATASRPPAAAPTASRRPRRPRPRPRDRQDRPAPAAGRDAAPGRRRPSCPSRRAIRRERREWLKARLDELFAAPALAKAKVSAIVDRGGHRQDDLRARREDAAQRRLEREDRDLGGGARRCSAPSTAGARRCRSSGRPAGRRSPPAARWRAISTCAARAIRRCRPRISPTMVGDLAALGPAQGARGRWSSTTRCSTAATIPPAYDQKNDSTASRAPSSAASLNGNVVAVTIIPGAGRRRARARRASIRPRPTSRSPGGSSPPTSGPAAPAVDTKEDGGPHARQRRRADQAGRRPAHLLPAGRAPVAVPRVHAQAAAWSGAGSPSAAACASASRPRRGCACWPRTTRRRSRSRSRISTSARTTSPPSSWCARSAPRSAAVPETGTRGSRRSPATSPASASRAGSYQMTNGSGLYDSNRFSAEQIVTVLRAASRDFRISAEFLASLRGRRHRRHHRPPNGRHARRALRTRQDRHARQRELPVGIRRLARATCRSCSRSW